MRRQGFGVATTAGDPDSPPSSAPCSQCGDRVDPTWYEPHPRHNRAGWWLPPQPVCSSCVQRVEAQEAADRLDRLQQRSGVPWRYRRYSWGDKVLEHAGEPWHQFRARVQATGRATVGVSRANVDAFRAFRDWRPRGMRSLYLEGTVGTGKTLFAKAIVLADGQGTKAAVLAMDICMLDRHNVACMRQTISIMIQETLNN